jgi:hypothetical protein
MRQAIVLDEILEPGRCAVALEIGRCGAQDAANRRDLARHQAGIGQFRDADGHVVAVADDVDEIVGQDQIDRKIGIGFHEGAEMRRDMQTAERGRRRDFQRAARGRRAARHEGFRLLDAGQDRHNAFVKALASFGQRDLPRRALQETANRAGPPAGAAASKRLRATARVRVRRRTCCRPTQLGQRFQGRQNCSYFSVSPQLTAITLRYGNYLA